MLAFLLAGEVSSQFPGITGTVENDSTGDAGLTEAPAANNVPADQPVLVQPPDGAADVSLSPVLEVTVSDGNASDVLNVVFYGRKAGQASAGEDFMIAVIPDPQNYATSYPEIYYISTQWIADNKSDSNIVFATCVGDLVNYSNSITEYTRADAAFDILDAGNVAYSVSPGNHDIAYGTTYWASYFGTSRFSGKSWYGGSYDNNNSFSLFSASGLDFIMINLQYNPPAAILDWADGLLKTYPVRQGIIVQHDILNVDNSWNNSTSFNALKDNPNLLLMLCGHMHTSTDGAAYREETGDDGHAVHIMQADYQEYPNGGNGYLRLLRFSPADDRIYATTYSPYLDAGIVTIPDRMEMACTMDGGDSFVIVGTEGGVTNGESASLNWPDLDPESGYEWYVSVSDGMETINGPTWSFSTVGTTVNHNLTMAVDPPGSGTTIPAAGVHSYVEGEVVSVTAIPADGYAFDHWSDNVADPVALTTTVTMNADQHLTSFFVPEPGKCGDVNGDDQVNSTDALIILSCDVGLDVSQFCPLNCGDANADGLVNSTDALIILSYDAGLSVPFPVGEPGCPAEVIPCAGCAL